MPDFRKKRRAQCLKCGLWQKWQVVPVDVFGDTAGFLCGVCHDLPCGIPPYGAPRGIPPEIVPPSPSGAPARSSWLKPLFPIGWNYLVRKLLGWKKKPYEKKPEKKSWEKKIMGENRRWQRRELQEEVWRRELQEEVQRRELQEEVQRRELQEEVVTRGNKPLAVRKQAQELYLQRLQAAQESASGRMEEALQQQDAANAKVANLLEAEVKANHAIETAKSELLDITQQMADELKGGFGTEGTEEDTDKGEDKGEDESCRWADASL
jgi:hypothetical protein